MAQAKIIDHFAVVIQSTDGGETEWQSITQPKVEHGFLVVYRGMGQLHFNLATINAWSFNIVGKE